MLNLRDYQADLRNEIMTAWERHRNVMAVLPTGGGKTVIFSSIMHDHVGRSCAIAHRQELVSQMSLSLARMEVRHQIIGPRNVVRFCMDLHRREVGESFYHPQAQHLVAGVDTIIARRENLARDLEQVTLWIMDEGHHLLQSNKWGRAVELMPNAKGLGVTATPCRADNKGLGRHADGVIDAMVEGPTMRWLIEQGYLTDYRIFAPPSDLDIASVTVSQATGDYNPQSLRKAVARSHLVGDVVEHYQRLANGRLGVTFATDVETAAEIAKQFNAAGTPAEIVSAKTPNVARQEIITRFRRRELLQLVNVDLFGEGFDLPAIEVVSMARPTQSYSLYTQQFGRALRPLEGKQYALIIDHAGNVVRHGLPDKERIWTLDGRTRSPRMRNPDDEIPLRYCVECTQPYLRSNPACPYCGHVPVPADRSTPEQVDGDLCEMSPELLARLRGQIDQGFEHPSAVAARMRRAGAPEIAARGAEKQIRLRQEAIRALRESMRWWGGLQRQRGISRQEAYRRFYFRYGVDVLTAQLKSGPDALELAERINEDLVR